MLRPGETPREGDGLSMREDGASRASHAGILVALGPGAPAHVLHCLPGNGVVRHRIDELDRIRLAPGVSWRFPGSQPVPDRVPGSGAGR